MKFDKVWTNVGNGYDPNTGIFTAPRAGLNHITAVILSQDGKTFYPTLYHNMMAVSGSCISGGGLKTGTFDVVFSLQKEDQVYITGYSRTFTIYSNSFPHVTFSGHSIAYAQTEIKFNYRTCTSHIHLNVMIGFLFECRYTLF